MKIDSIGLSNFAAKQWFGDDFWMAENPTPRPSITVQEAYDLKVIDMGAHLGIDFRAYEYDDSWKTVESIRAGNKRDGKPIDFVVYAGGIANTVEPDEKLVIFAETVNEYLMWAVFLRKLAELWSLKHQEVPEDELDNPHNPDQPSLPGM